MSLPNNFKKFNLSLPTVSIKRRLVMTSEADTGCGKSDLMMRSAPKPLLVVDLDNNLEGLEDKYKDDSILIYHAVIPAKYQPGNKAHRTRDFNLAMEIQDLFLEAVDSNYFRSILVDTNNKLWELARRGLLENGGQDFSSDKRTDYGPANNYMESFFNAAKSKRINFCMTCHTKEEYKGGKPTNQRVAGGWKEAVLCSQCHVRMYKDKGGVVPDKFHMEILKCSWNSELEGLELHGEEISFPALGMLIFPQTSEEDWV